MPPASTARIGSRSDATTLRHSCAAFAFSLKMTPVEVARLLRHSDPAVTLSVYAGLTRADDATVAGLGEKLAAGLRPH
jgi:integrase